MINYPHPPADWVTMPQQAQHQFEVMLIVPLVLAAAYCIWGAFKHRSLVPVWIFLGGGLAYMAEPLVNAVGGIWYPQVGQHEVFTSMGRAVPWFGLIAYAWFLGGTSFLCYDRMAAGLSAGKIWALYITLVIAEVLMEIPGLNMGAYTYYGNQPFVLMKFPVWWAFVNAAAPVATGALVYRMAPHIKPLLQPIIIYSVAFTNAGVMGACALPTEFFLNRDASMGIMRLAGSLTIACACFIVYLVTVAVAVPVSRASGAAIAAHEREVQQVA